MEPGDEDEAFSSNRQYATKCLAANSEQQILEIAKVVAHKNDDDNLARAVEEVERVRFRVVLKSEELAE